MSSLFFGGGKGGQEGRNVSLASSMLLSSLVLLRNGLSFYSEGKAALSFLRLGREYSVFGFKKHKAYVLLVLGTSISCPLPPVLVPKETFGSVAMVLVLVMLLQLVQHPCAL